MPINVITAVELDGTAHGFLTRNGGVSTGIYDSLNCGRGSDDDSNSVDANRHIVAGYFDLDVDRLHSLHQVHSANVITITTPAMPKVRPKADAMVTRLPNIGLGVLTADCAPVLFADKSRGIIGAAHAGWKGALFGVVDSTIAAMVNLGAQPIDIVAVIGPCISQQAYEVGPEFVEVFHEQSSGYSKFFARGDDDRSYFDLPGFILHRLEARGVASASWTGHCTYSTPGQFFSYRRNTHNSAPDYGRMLSVITNR